jgi:DNA repair protein RecO (recombination protein O)
MPLYRDHGVILRTYKLGEADRILHICTMEHGKVRAVAKGVRKTRSKFGARLEPTSHCALQLYGGRELDIVTQAETVDHFRAIREDFDRFAKATTMLEAVDLVLQEGESAPEIYTMLVRALRALAERDTPLVAPAFHLKLLAHDGVAPHVDSCVSCGEADEPMVAFDVASGGTTCANCRQGRPLSPEAHALLLQILGGQLGAALNEEPSSTTHEVTELATRALEYHLERRLRAHQALERS